MTSENVESVLQENRLFNPPKDFQAKAHLKSEAEYQKLYDESIQSTEEFWKEQSKILKWQKDFKEVLDWSNAPIATWFKGGKLNLSENCIDRHIENGLAKKTALIWEGEVLDGKRPVTKSYTYEELLKEVSQFANVLEGLGVKAGDRVAIYMPMIPEALFAMQACARIGAIHTVIFGGFSSEAIADRVKNADVCLVITADAGNRRGKPLPLKAQVDEALKKSDGVKNVLCIKHLDTEVDWKEGRDHWYHELAKNADITHAPKGFDSEHPLFILYTSGTTGKPKGVVHTTAGYLLGTTLSTKYVFDLKEDDIYWCTADIGWITGHSYFAYGPLSNGTTLFMYEGAPNYPDAGRFWQMIERHKITILYTAPTAIRAFMKWGDEFPKASNLSSLRLLGTVGEPINPEAWTWYREVIGGNQCPIVDTWWQTETGGIMCTPLPGVTSTKPGSCTKPFFGVDMAIVDKSGKEVRDGNGGYLIIRKPWPSMMRGVWGDNERFKTTYWKDFAGSYFTGDGARKDKDGYFWIMGRVDDVVNVSGHRLGTMEVESALVAQPNVVEAAVVGRPDEIKGQALCAFVTLKNGVSPTDTLKQDLKNWVAKEIGSIAKPDDIRFTEALPKTRSGKIMRRLLRDIAAGKETLGDTTTLEDYSVLAKLKTEDCV